MAVVVLSRSEYTSIILLKFYSTDTRYFLFREKQKQLKEDKKEKRKTQKGERKR